MDSVSQMALGAGISYVLLGPRLGKRSLLLGAALGTLPDFDVLVPYADAIDSFTYHRSFSHSLLVLTLFSPLLAWLCQKIFNRFDYSFGRWWLTVWLILFTHPLLDSLTIYGTQIGWPIDKTPVAIGSIFIIDPLYTLPLLIAILMAWRKSKQAAARNWMVTGLSLSTVYLATTVWLQTGVRDRLEQTLKRQAVDAETLVIAPFPLSLLWRTVAVTEDSYYEGFASLFDESRDISLHAYSNGHQTCAEWLRHRPVDRLDWFTRGAFALSVSDSTLIATDLRMGIEDNYVFEFDIAEWQEGHWQAMQTRLRPVAIETARFKNLLYRVVDESVDMQATNSPRLNSSETSNSATKQKPSRPLCVPVFGEGSSG